MILPENFIFSQQNLQDFTECRLRFLLKYVRKVEWPAVQSEPVLQQEARMELGQQFHRMVQQYFAGIDLSLLASTIQSPELMNWWSLFTALNMLNLPSEKHAETLLSIPFENYRLVAKYDLLIKLAADRFIIYDWKTSQYHPTRLNMLQRLQSVVYPFVLQQSVSGNSVTAARFSEIEMVYWFPAYPSEPIHIRYTYEKYLEDQEMLTHTIGLIHSLPENKFEKTTDNKKCNYCRYRSHCDRGILAGVIPPEAEFLPEGNEFDLDFDAL